MQTIDSDRARGAFIGLAAGDAVGTTLEFCRPGSFVHIEDMLGGGPFDLAPGFWTDDTSMGLCLAESLIETGTFDPRDQLERYVRWRDDGHLSSTGRCFDIGATTTAALSRFLERGSTVNNFDNERAAANGSLMRLSPVAIRYAASPEECIYLCGESSRTTHGLRICVDACRLLGAILCVGIAGGSKESMLAPSVVAVLEPTIAAIAEGSYMHKMPPRIRGTGYVVESLEAALWAFFTTDTFRECVLAAANLGDDADTTAAIAGQIAGAYYGASGIPQAWRERLARRDLIDSYAEQLVRLSGSGA